MLTRYVQRNLTWIDLVAPTPPEMRLLMQEFGIDPALAEELLIPSFKSKVERRSEMTYVILLFPVLRGLHQRPEQEIDFIIGKNFLITVRYGGNDPLQIFAKAFEVGSVLNPQGTHAHGGHLFASMARNIYLALNNECDGLKRKMQEIEEYIFSGDERKMVIEISHTGRIIHDFRQSLLPHEEILQSLEPACAKLFGPEFSLYIRAVTGEYARVRSVLEHLRDALHELRATNDSLLSTKQNEIMKTLTIIASLMFPLTLISSIFGMNARYLPIVGTPGDFWIIIGMMAALAASFIVYFFKKGWL